MERAKYQQGEWTILTITDNGITIPARYRGRRHINPREALELAKESIEKKKDNS